MPDTTLEVEFTPLDTDWTLPASANEHTLQAFIWQVALWAQQPRSLLDTANALNIPQRYVFAFYSAACSLQQAGEARRAVDTLIAPPTIEKSKFRGLFGNLLDRLRGGRKSHE
jgi:hypothetical protein